MVELKKPGFEYSGYDVALLDKSSRRFEGTYCLHLQDFKVHGHCNLEEDTDKFLRNVRSHLPRDAASLVEEWIINYTAVETLTTLLKSFISNIKRR